MLILIYKLTEILKNPDFPENYGKMLIPEFVRKFRIFCSGTNWESIRMVLAINIQNFRLIGRIVSEKQGGWIPPPPDSFIAQNTWTGDRVKHTVNFVCIIADTSIQVEKPPERKPS